MNKPTKIERDSFRKKMIGIITRVGVISTRDLAHKLGVGYSKVYIPLSHTNEVREFKQPGRQRFWALSDTKHIDVKDKLHNYKSISPVKRGRPALVVA